jgi:hypothetical protein
MTFNPLPPQAYTKETLQKAYAWLLGQSPSVKDLATTQDILVSMYLKAQRNGEAALDTPSIQNFKQELKSLAHLIGDLQTPDSASSSAKNNSTASRSPSEEPAQAKTSSIKMPQTFLSSSPIPSGLDDISLSAIQEVKQALNLSSDTEALRALISLGYKQFKKI